MKNTEYKSIFEVGLHISDLNMYAYFNAKSQTKAWLNAMGSNHNHFKYNISKYG
jgi:hypothetical protein